MQPDDAERQFELTLEKASSELANGTPQSVEAAVRAVAELAEAFGEVLDRQPNSPSARHFRAMEEADVAEEAGDWEAAYRICVQALDIAIADEQVPLQARSCFRLARIDEQRGNSKEAYIAARLGMESARKAGISTLLEMVTCAFARHACAVGRREEALAAIAESLRELPETPQFAVSRAKLESMHASVLLEMRELDGAEQAILRGHRALNDVAHTWGLPGVKWTLGNLWRVEAKMRSAMRQPAETRSAGDSCLSCMRVALESWREWQVLSSRDLAECEVELADAEKELATQPDCEAR